MIGKLQQAKIQHLFNMLDSDKNGLLESTDLSEMVDRISKLRGHAPGSPLYQHMLQVQMGWWEGVRQAADKDKSGQVTLNEWLEFWSGWIDAIAEESKSGASPSLDALKQSATSTFDMIDRDGNGVITAREYGEWSEAMGVRGDKEAIFRRLDANGDGQVSRDESIQIVKDYILTNDPEAPGNHLYGRF